MTPLRVLLVDDSPEFFSSAEQFLSHAPLVEIVGRATGGRDAVRLTGELRPDIVLMDWAMLDMDGLQATRLITARQPATRVVLVSFYDDEQLRAAAAEAGAAGFISKAKFGETVLALVESLRPNPPDVTGGGGGQAAPATS